ncbi:amino acid ABC transporter permease [Castellaniella defragrans]|jgi:polar amino acid transport system permease protein|uniref:amino acid ABC transporter permease n=1 Tax=Castellaniella defragrans TaxID=75697 RepID=UPI0023F12B66|nr:amino acid ABC transporter permease [Castellaniella defragrans]
MSQEQIAYLLEGAWGTILLSLLTFLFSAMLGLLVALMRVSDNIAIRGFAGGYINVIQGTPLLVTMGICFYGPSIFGLGSMSALFAAVLALTVQSAAFLGEIWRGSIQAVPRNQWEAAECLGLSRIQRMFRVILPQALKIATPPTVGFMVQIVKNTSFASLVIGFAELTYNAKILNNATFKPFLYFGFAAILYFMMCFPLSWLSLKLERRLTLSRN